MINSAQFSERSRFSPEVKTSTSYEKIVPKTVEIQSINPENNQVKKSIEGVSTLSSDVGKVTANQVEQNPIKPITVSKFVAEVKGIFSRFLLELNQFAVPTKNAQELT